MRALWLSCLLLAASCFGPVAWSRGGGYPSAPLINIDLLSHQSAKKSVVAPYLVKNVPIEKIDFHDDDKRSLRTVVFKLACCHVRNIGRLYTSGGTRRDVRPNICFPSVSELSPSSHPQINILKSYIPNEIAGWRLTIIDRRKTDYGRSYAGACLDEIETTARYADICSNLSAAYLYSITHMASMCAGFLPQSPSRPPQSAGERDQRERLK